MLMKRLYRVLEENIELYNTLLKLEKIKYEVVLQDDVMQLNDIIDNEQVIYMKMRGLDIKREDIIEELGFKGKTLKEIAEETEYGEDLESYINTLRHIIMEIKSTNKACEEIIEIRLRRVGAMIDKIENNTVKNNNDKNIINKERHNGFSTKI